VHAGMHTPAAAAPSMSAGVSHAGEACTCSRLLHQRHGLLILPCLQQRRHQLLPGLGTVHPCAPVAGKHSLRRLQVARSDVRSHHRRIRLRQRRNARVPAPPNGSQRALRVPSSHVAQHQGVVGAGAGHKALCRHLVHHPFCVARLAAPRRHAQLVVVCKAGGVVFVCQALVKRGAATDVQTQAHAVGLAVLVGGSSSCRRLSRRLCLYIRRCKATRVVGGAQKLLYRVT
jgi:hypothetical protein